MPLATEIQDRLTVEEGQAGRGEDGVALVSLRGLDEQVDLDVVEEADADRERGVGQSGGRDGACSEHRRAVDQTERALLERDGIPSGTTDGRIGSGGSSGRC